MARRVLIVDDSATVRRAARRTLEESGFEVLEASDGREGLALAQRERPDLLLVDERMPHLDGRGMCRGLAEVEALRRLPVVAVCARDQRLAEGFARDIGAVDVLSKPFSPMQLLAVTAHARGALVAGPAGVTARRKGRSGAERPDSAAPEPPENEVTEPLGPRDERTDPGGAAPSVAALVGPAADPAELAQALARELPPETLRALAHELLGVPDEGPSEVSFAGLLRDVPLGEILQMLAHQRQTGVLEVARESQGMSICVREGLLDVAVGSGTTDELRLGRYAAQEELVTRDEIEKIVARSGGRADRQLLGAQLVKLGYLSDDDLTRLLSRQTHELLYEALRWRDGTFRFVRLATRREATSARLGLAIPSILMEGLKRVDEWRLVEEQIRSFDVVLVVRRDAVAALDQDSLSREEGRVLASVDGRRNVRQIVRESQMASFDACTILYRLISSGLVAERS